MPDFKYTRKKSGQIYSKLEDYPKYAKKALKEMDRQVEGLKVDSRGLAYRGLMIRHLILPGGLEETKEVLDFIHEELSPDVFVNLMDQYTPSYKAFEYKELSRRISPRECRQAEDYARGLGLF